MNTLEQDLTALFRAQAQAIRPGPADREVLVVDELADRRQDRRFRGALGAAAALLLVVAGVAWLTSRDGSGATGAGAAVSWRTPQASLDADAFEIEVGTGGKFTAVGARVDVRSDPDAQSPTLELTWHERGIEMRLMLYFATDGHDWWVREMRTYDGAAVNADWVTFSGGVGGKAQYFRSALGACALGDVDLTSADGSTSSHIRIDNMRLCAFLAGPPTTGLQPPPPPADMPVIATDPTAPAVQP